MLDVASKLLIIVDSKPDAIEVHVAESRDVTSRDIEVSMITKTFDWPLKRALFQVHRDIPIHKKKLQTPLVRTLLPVHQIPPIDSMEHAISVPAPRKA